MWIAPYAPITWSTTYLPGFLHQLAAVTHVTSSQPTCTQNPGNPTTRSSEVPSSACRAYSRTLYPICLGSLHCFGLYCLATWELSYFRYKRLWSTEERGVGKFFSSKGEELKIEKKRNKRVSKKGRGRKQSCCYLSFGTCFERRNGLFSLTRWTFLGFQRRVLELWGGRVFLALFEGWQSNPRILFGSPFLFSSSFHV